jgi:ribosomal protein L7Ae-like RNA K-turn-binding protein
LINKKILGLIGFAARARKICFGADSVELQIKKKKVYLIIVALDSSERTKEKFKNICEQYDIPIIIKGEIDSLSKAIGKSNKAIIGIEDINLANEIQKINDGGEAIG